MGSCKQRGESHLTEGEARVAHEARETPNRDKVPSPVACAIRITLKNVQSGTRKRRTSLQEYTLGMRLSSLLSLAAWYGTPASSHVHACHVRILPHLLGLVFRVHDPGHVIRNASPGGLEALSEGKLRRRSHRL
jgi:hypothetical protein